MKKLLFLLFIFTFCSCHPLIDDIKRSSTKHENPIKVKCERTIGMYTDLTIIEIDGHEYISIHNRSGKGEATLVHSESCPCKQINRLEE